MPSNPPVLVERRGDVALVTLNAPERRNAIDLSMVNALHRVIDDLIADPNVAAVVLTGAGDKAFAAGADIAQLRERTSAQALAAINSSLFRRIEDLPVPVVAAIRGYALGGGCELAIACDLRVAGESARMGQPEVKLGIIPGAGATYRLPRLVGAGRARDLIFTGRMLDAQECLRIGLVDRVVPDAEVVEAALALAAEIAGNGRLAVRMAKLALNAVTRPTDLQGSAVENAAQALCFDSEDKRARMDAFLAKRDRGGPSAR
ncbi:MAG TPA: enoyl-CoA hydratase-related protein [Planctomycetota bacterium]|nr:enoyl-CoA hydratase-related protein [Planctomycetota bacterium]